MLILIILMITIYYTIECKYNNALYVNFGCYLAATEFEAFGGSGTPRGWGERI